MLESNEKFYIVTNGCSAKKHYLEADLKSVLLKDNEDKTINDTFKEVDVDVDELVDFRLDDGGRLFISSEISNEFVTWIDDDTIQINYKDGHETIYLLDHHDDINEDLCIEFTTKTY